MNRYVPFFFLLLLTFSVIGGTHSQTLITIEPHIGEYAISVTQTYTLDEGLTEFEILTLSLSYADLSISDEKGDLDYQVGQNVIIGRNIYRYLTVYFREPTEPGYTFTVSYWFPTYTTGKPLTGKYVYRIVNLTDSTVVKITIPLTGITETSRASPSPVVEEHENSTTFLYEFSEDTTITLPYELEEGIDYTNTETESISHLDYTFEVTYPEGAEIFLEDVKYFITTMFPVYLELTGTPLQYERIKIALAKEEDTWAAAEYRGGGRIRILINNTASYPSRFFAHELTHSYIGDFPRYLEEGMAEYFEGQTASHFALPRPDDYIPNEELFFQTYERQFGERVDVTQFRYGLGLTDHQEALIYAKYSKGTYIIYEIAYFCGHGTIQEMLKILKEHKDCDVNFVIFQISEGETVYTILKRYGFDVVPPHAYPAEALLQEVQEQSWWSYVLCFVSGFKSDIRAAAPDDIAGLKGDIAHTGDIASKTVLLADGVVVVLLIVVGYVTAKKVYYARKENPKIGYYGYLIPVIISSGAFSYFLYEFLFSGYKFRWILRNILTHWGLGIVLGAIIIVAVTRVFPEGRQKYAADVVWAASFFVLLMLAAYFVTLSGLMLTSGYAISLATLFIMRRREK